jgi:hypothetical protein
LAAFFVDESIDSTDNFESDTKAWISGFKMSSESWKRGRSGQERRCGRRFEIVVTAAFVGTGDRTLDRMVMICCRCVRSVDGAAGDAGSTTERKDERRFRDVCRRGSEAKISRLVSLGLVHEGCACSHIYQRLSGRISK